MLKTYLLVTQSFKRLSDRLIASKAWPWNISIYTYVLLVFISFPSYELFFQPNTIVLKNWQAQNAQCENPFAPNPYPADEHEGQIAFRLLLPLISHMAGTNIFPWFVIQHLAGLAFIGLVAQYLKRTLVEPKLIILAFGAIAFTYLFKGFFVDILGYFDGMGWLLLLGACLLPSAPALTVLTFLAAYVDERCIMALPFVVLLKIILRPDLEQHPLWSAFSLKYLLAGSASLVLTLSLRWYLSTHYGLAVKADQTHTVGLEVIRENYKVAPLILLTGLDFLMPALWIPVLILYNQRRRLEAFLLGAYLLVATVACLIVYDMSRTTCYLFPGVLLLVGMLARHETRKVQVQVLAFLFVANFLMPPLFSVGEDILWMGPMLPKLVKLIFAA